MNHDADTTERQDAVSWTGDETKVALEPSALLCSLSPRDASCGATQTDCGCATEERRNFFEGTCLPKRERIDRSEFLDGCLSAQENERLRMGRELHDSTGQLLVALRLGIAHLRHAQGSGNTAEIIDEIDEIARQIDREIRTFAFLHYPAELGRNGLASALETLVRGFGHRTGLRISFYSICKQAVANPAVAVALLRVAQEALTNIYRHAHASLAKVTLIERRGTLELSVSDDGCGMPRGDDHSVVDGVGLHGMRHRIERLGGRFAVRRLKQGTKLVASLPVIQPPALLAV